MAFSRTWRMSGVISTAWSRVSWRCFQARRIRPVQRIQTVSSRAVPRRSALSRIAAAASPGAISASARWPKGAATGPETPSANCAERGALRGKRARAVTAKLSPTPSARGPSQVTATSRGAAEVSASTMKSASSSTRRASPAVQKAGANTPTASAIGATIAA